MHPSTPALRPHTYIYDAPDGTRWRGGLVWAIVGSVATLRIRNESWSTRDYTRDIADLPSPVIGAPIVVRLIGEFPYSVAEIQESHFSGADGYDVTGKIARGEFIPAVVPRSITHESETMWSTDQWSW